MNRNYVVILQSARLGRVTDRIELGEFARIGNAETFLTAKAINMWGGDNKSEKAKSPSIGTVFYHDKEQYRIELFIQPRLVEIEEFSRANAPQT